MLSGVNPALAVCQPLVMLILLSHGMAAGYNVSLGSSRFDHFVRRKPVQAFCDGLSFTATGPRINVQYTAGSGFS